MIFLKKQKCNKKMKNANKAKQSNSWPHAQLKFRTLLLERKSTGRKKLILT